jgi:hypothetical protein
MKMKMDQTMEDKNENEKDIQEQVLKQIPESNIVYAEVVHWITIISAIAALFIPVFILAHPSNNMLNPNKIFGAIFSGATPAEIWSASSAGAFPGAHFYLRFPWLTDSWAQLFINIGCAVGLFGLVPAVIIQVFKEKDWFCAILGVILALFIFLSMTGILM